MNIHGGRLYYLKFAFQFRALGSETYTPINIHIVARFPFCLPLSVYIYFSLIYTNGSAQSRYTAIGNKLQTESQTSARCIGAPISDALLLSAVTQLNLEPLVT